MLKFTIQGKLYCAALVAVKDTGMIRCTQHAPPKVNTVACTEIRQKPGGQHDALMGISYMSGMLLVSHDMLC